MEIHRIPTKTIGWIKGCEMKEMEWTTHRVIINSMPRLIKGYSNRLKIAFHLILTHCRLIERVYFNMKRFESSTKSTKNLDFEDIIRY
jgi:hypothetical protein